MELNFYTLCVLYLVYSFLGWVAETVVATIKGRAFVNRGVASGPFCFVYGTAAVLMAVGFATCARRRWPSSSLCSQRHRGGVGDGQVAGEDAPPPLVGLLG